MENKHKVMGTENVGKLLLKFSLPAIAGMLVNALYNIVDRIYIGNITHTGDLAIAGIGIVFPIVIFAFGFAILVGLGTATNISLNLGRKDQITAEKYLGSGLFYAIFVSLILVVGVSIFLKPLVFSLGGSAKTAPFAIEYMRIVAFGFPASIICYVANASIRADGSPRMAMYTSLIGATTNIILDPIFIFYFGWGVKGAATATIISQYLSCGWTMYYFLSSHSLIKIYSKYIKFSLSKIKEISIIGSAPFAIQMGSSLINSIYNITLKSHGGDTAIGAMTVVQSIILFVLMPIFGINQGIQPILGYNYGARLYGRVREALFKGIFAATGICSFYFVIIQLFPHFIVRIFTNNTTLIAIATRGLRLSMMFLPLIGFQIIATVYFQAIGKPKMSLFLSLSRQIILLIPAILILPRYFGNIGVWYAEPVADSLSILLTFYLIRRELKNLKKQEEIVENKNNQK